MNNIISTFQKYNLKLTPQRIAVYKYLLDTKEHPPVEKIYTCLHKDYPTMSLATVYKTLNTFVQLGLVHEINFGEGNSRYDSNINPHSHLQCTKCGKIIDIFDLDCNSLSKEVEGKYGYNLLRTNIYFYGTCLECHEDGLNIQVN